MFINKKLLKINNKNIIYWKISENSLFKILILEIKDKNYFFFWYLKKNSFYLWFTRPMFLLNYLNLFMITFYLFFCLIFIFGLFSFIYSYKHLLNILLRLEFIVLSLFLILFFFLSLNNFELYFSIYFLTFSVCEGVLGLSILVSIIRTHGNDYFLNFSLLQC